MERPETWRSEYCSLGSALRLYNLTLISCFWIRRSMISDYLFLQKVETASFEIPAATMLSVKYSKFQRGLDFSSFWGAFFEQQVFVV